MAEPILKLSTKKVRRFIEIDDQQFDMQDIDDLSLPEQYEFRNRTERIRKAHLEGAELSAEQVADLSASINTITQAIVPGISSTLDKLTDNQKVAILTAFLAVPAKSTATKTDAGNSSTALADSAGSLAEPFLNGADSPEDSLETVKASWPVCARRNA